MQGDTLSKIVDHKNYSPRIVESMTDKLHVGGIPPALYDKAFIAALDNPHQIWDIAFRNLPAPRRHLLYALFFSSQYGVELDELKQAYNALHPALCASFGHSHDPKDFEDSVKALESGFIKLQGRNISFINPSLRDYLNRYFGDLELLTRIALTAQKVSWMEAAWNHVYFNSVLGSERFSQEDVRTLASALAPLIDKVLTLPIRKNDVLYDTYISERIDLLLSWFAYTEDERFATAALALAQSPPDAFSVWRDGTKVVELIAQIPSDYGSTQHTEALVRALEQALIGMLEGGVDADGLESIASTVESYRRMLSKEVTTAMENAIIREVDDAMATARGIGSEFMLSEHAEVLRKFGRSAGVPEDRLERAVSSIEERIAEIKAETKKAAAPQFGRKAQKEDDAFDNAALRNLFAALAPDRS